MSKPRNPGYIGGNHWEICDKCGEAWRSSEMKTQWDGLRVCPPDYDKRHPQEAVRDRDAELCANKADSGGLDWAGGDRNYQPDLDPTSFIQEPNDAYFTNPPDGNFGYSDPPTLDDYITELGPWWWLAADKVSDTYNDGYVFDATDRVQDQSVYDRDFYYQGATTGVITYKTNAVNGLPAFNYADGGNKSAVLRALPSGGAGAEELEEMPIWIFIVISNVDLKSGGNVLACPFAEEYLSGGYQYMGFANSPTIPSPYTSTNVFVMSNNSGLSKNCIGAGGWVSGGGPYLLSGKFEGGSIENSYLRVNGLNPVLDMSSLIAVPDTIPQDIYPRADEGQMMGSRFVGYIPESINFRKDLTATEVRTIEEGLVSKYGISDYTYQDIR